MAVMAGSGEVAAISARRRPAAQASIRECGVGLRHAAAAAGSRSASRPRLAGARTADMLGPMSERGILVIDRRAWVRDIAFTAITSLVFTFLAPFGTDRTPLELRLVQNFALGFASFAILWPPMRLALRFGDRHGLPELFVLAGGLTVLSLPVAALGMLIVGRMHPGVPQLGLTGVYFMVLAMVLPVGTAYLMVERRLLRPPADAAPASEAPAPATAAAPPKLLARLSPRLGADILALQGEDHYVRVHTPLGSELLLMRLGDAIDELEGLAGERVHRSWWVAPHAVTAVRANGRRLSLTLTNGAEVPVTRDAATRLRREGWLKR
jgi:hypothetical protein